MFYLEFLGMPGAGKSTLRNAIISSSLENNIHCISSEEAFLIALKSKKDDLLMRFILNVLPGNILKKHNRGILDLYKDQSKMQGCFIARHTNVLDILSYYTHTPQISMEEKSLVISRFLSFCSFYQIVREGYNRKKPIIFDSAFLQKAMSIFVSPAAIDREIKYKDVHCYIDAFPLPDVMIFLEAEIDSCLHRLKNRPRGPALRMNGLNNENIKAFLTRSNHLFQMIADIAGAKGVNIIRLKNDMALGEAVSQLIKLTSKAIS